MILFIDDESRIMDSYKQFLELKLKPDGYEVLYFSDVDEALEYFESRAAEVDLIILDIMMPPGERFKNKKANGGLKTGFLFYNEVRGRSPDLPVVIFTNFFDEDEERRFRQDPKCYFIHKSTYRLEDFVKEVRKALALPAV